MQQVHEDVLSALSEYEDDDDGEYAEYDDDDDEDIGLSAEYDDESAEYDDDDDESAEFLSLLAPVVGKALFGRRKRPRRPRTPQFTRHVRGSRTAVARTPAGALQVQFSKRFVSKTELQQALRSVRTSINRTSSYTRKEITAVRKQMTTALAAQNKRYARQMRRADRRMKKQLADLQQMMLLPMLLGDDNPEIESIDVRTPDGTIERIDVERTQYEESDDNLLPLILMMSGGLGSGSNTALLALALAD